MKKDKSNKKIADNKTPRKKAYSGPKHHAAKPAKELFQNGTQVVHAYTERGISLYSILEGAWMLPILLMGLRQRIWEAVDVKASNPVINVWFKLNLVAGVYEENVEPPKKPEIVGMKLTQQGEALILCADLLEYEHSMISQQIAGDFDTDPAKYVALRRGLANYTAVHIPEVLEWIQELTPKGARVLDLCGGCGQYLMHILSHDPTATGILFDKAPGITQEIVPEHCKGRVSIIAGNALEHPIYEAEENACDIVIMSEILHCMGEEARGALIKRAFRVLKPGGLLAVIEQFPNMRLDVRLWQLTENGQCLDKDRIAYEVQAVPFKPFQTVDAISHFGVMFTKQTEESANE